MHSGLVSRRQFFDQEQMTEIYRAIHGFLSEQGPDSIRQEEKCRQLLAQIKSQIPDLEQRLKEVEGHTFEQSMVYGAAKRALPFLFYPTQWKVPSWLYTLSRLHNMHRNLFLPLSAGIQRVVRLSYPATAFSAGAATATACGLEWRKSTPRRKNDADQNGALHNTDHLEYGIVTILFPIPRKTSTTAPSKCWRHLTLGTHGKGCVVRRSSQARFPV